MTDSDKPIDNQQVSEDLGDPVEVIVEGAEDVEKASVAEECASGTPTEEGSEPDEPAVEELDPLTAAQNETNMWKEVALRSKAELENFRKRMARERSDAVRFANVDLLQALFPVLDNFEMGLTAAKAEEGSSIYLGMQMVQKQIQDFLSEQGVETIEALGQPFDPNLHDALSQEPNAEVPEGSVSFQVRRGYRLHDRLLRPAAVHVSTGSGDGETA